MIRAHSFAFGALCEAMLNTRDGEWITGMSRPLVNELISELEKLGFYLAIEDHHSVGWRGR